MNPFDVKGFDKPEAFRRESLKAYKRIFSKTIKESFLIDIINRIERDPRYIALLLNVDNINDLFSMDSVVVGKNTSFLNTCKMIVMCHYVNTVNLSDAERGKKQEDTQYKAELIDDVVEMFKLQRLATPGFSNSSLESFLPIIYYISALNNLCGDIYTNLTNKNIEAKKPYISEFNYKMIYKLLIKIRACISLADIGATDELMVIYRTLIELFMTYFALWDKDENAIKAFYEFDNATFEYNYNQKIPENMESEAKKLKVNKVNYINYGWIIKLEEYQKIFGDSPNIGLGGLAKVLDAKYEHVCADFGSTLYTFYKSCNPQTHATLLIMNYFQLELYIFQNIAVMLNFICEIILQNLFTVSFKVGEIDLIGKLKEVLEQSKNILEWVGSDQNNLSKTNMDYANRANCSMKMR